MKKLQIPTPPNPDSFKGNALAYQRAVFKWMNDTKSRIEEASRQNDTPLGQNFVVSAYTTNTALSGTSTGTDITNFICSLVDAFTSKGVIRTTTST